MTTLDGVGWRSYPSWEVFGQETPLGCTLAVPVSRDDHLLGSASARVTIVFYGDYTNVASRDTYADLKQIESLAGHSLAVVYRHCVDLESDDHSVQFAEAAEAAGSQGRFWAAHDRFYRRPHTAVDEIEMAAVQIGLDLNRFRYDLAHRRFLPTVRTHRSGAHDSDVVRAPRLFINDVSVRVRIDVRDLWTLVQEELRRAEENLRPSTGRRAPRPRVRTAIADSA